MKRGITMLLVVMAIAVAAWGESGRDNRLPMDSAVRYGKLPNGLTYYIWHNEKPKQMCEFRIAQKVGAILEEDHQNGLAHFLEHMCFNGTEHFPGKGIINYFESIGVSFGGGINAYTSLDETVYMLSNVPTTREGILDSALLVLYDWSCAVSLLDKEIDNERGVIREEWRTGHDAFERLWDKYREIVMSGSQYAKRNIIGDTAIINNFTYQTLRDYYHKWYGPDLQGIIVVGDIDVDLMEQKIVKLFSPIKPREGMTPRTTYGALDNEKPIVGVALDKEAQDQEIEIGFKCNHPTAEQTLSLENYVISIKRDLISSCLNIRFHKLRNKPDCPLHYIGFYRGNIGGETDAYMMSARVKDGEELAAYRILCEELERFRRYGILKEELDELKKKRLKYIDQYCDDHYNRENNIIVYSCQSHFLDNYGPSLTPCEYDQKIYEEILRNTTVEELNEMIKGFFPADDRNMYIVATGKDKPDENGVGCAKCKMPTEEELLAIYQASRKAKIDAPTFTKTERPLVKKEPKPGRVTDRRECKEMGATELTLSNNIKVVVKKTDFEKNSIGMYAISEGGYSSYPKADLLNAEYATSIVSENGIGDFDAEELEKLLTDKTVIVFPSIDPYSEFISAYVNTKDFETMLQLNWLYFTSPRADNKRFEEWKKDMKSSLESELSSPKRQFSDRTGKVLYGWTDRYVRLDTGNINQINQKRALEIYKERFANPADFTFYFVGDIDIEDSATVALIEKWLGGMKTNNKMEKFTDDGMYMRSGVNYEYFKQRMETKTATNLLFVTGEGFEYNLKNIIITSIIDGILDRRYTESIREREGGTYGVSTRCYFDLRPKCTVEIRIGFDTDPYKQSRLMDIVYEEIEKIIAGGPLESDIEKEKEIIINNHKEMLIQDYKWLYDYMPMFYQYGINYNRDDFDDVVNSITGEDVRDMLKRLYEQKNHNEVVMMPAR